MALTFYPNPEDVRPGSIESRIDVLLDAAERFKAIVLDTAARPATEESGRRMGYIPRDQRIAYNWDEIASVLRAIRELPESSKSDKLKKAEFLSKLAEIYEVLRAAKMSKLEAVRLALISEVNQLRGSSSQVA
jgi:hypothetical protein